MIFGWLRYGASPLVSLLVGVELVIRLSSSAWSTIAGAVAGGDPTSLGGPIMLGGLAGDAVSQAAAGSYDGLVMLLIGTSILIAFVNLLPLPVLDGGQAMIAAAEGLARRRVPVRMKSRLLGISAAALIALMLAAGYGDVLRLIG